MAEVPVLLNEAYRLEDALRALGKACRRETGYRPRHLPDNLDGVRDLLNAPVTEDFTRLMELRRPDLTVEAVVLAFGKNAALFSEMETEIARQRLQAAAAQVRSVRIAER